MSDAPETIVAWPVNQGGRASITTLGGPPEKAVKYVRADWRPIDTAPRDGTPIVGVCGGVEMPVCWDDPLPGVLDAGWYYWDDEELGPSHERPRDQPQKWRELFYG